jgi:hypothetical protein
MTALAQAVDFHGSADAAKRENPAATPAFQSIVSAISDNVPPEEIHSHKLLEVSAFVAVRGRGMK